MQFKIAGLVFKNQLLLAPMYRVTDLPFRLLCRAQGAGLCFSEMINSEALIRDNKSNWRLAETNEEDFPLALQLFGARPQRITEILQSWADLGKPITAKIRIAPNVLHSIKIAKTIEKAGASALIVHARTIEQEHKGKVDFVAIKRIKKSLGIPVIGNGGIKGRGSFDLMLEKTKCDAIMIGTAAIGNPGVFSEILEKKPISREQALKEYLQLCSSLNFSHFGRIKLQTLRFLPGRENIPIREKIVKAKKLEELENCLNFAK